MDDDKRMTPVEVAAAMGINVNQLYKLNMSKRLPVRRIGKGRPFVFESELRTSLLSLSS